MLNIRKYINKLSNYRFFMCLILVFIFLSALIVILPNFNRYSNIITTSVSNKYENPYVNINIGEYSWNSAAYELDNYYFDSNITFEAEEVLTVKEIYYYISNTALTETEIVLISNWTLYENSVTLSVEGSYVVYIKVVDNSDIVSYLNTDMLILDLTDPTASISFDDYEYTTYTDSLNNIYADRSKSITLAYDDNFSGISEANYYISADELNLAELDALSTWSSYNEAISLINVGEYIIYAQIKDNADNTIYANTDKIVLNGYTQSNFIIGRNSSYLGNEFNITNKSTVTFNSTFEYEMDELTGYTHNLMSNILLPLDTKVTLIDNINDKVYEYVISTSEDIFNYNDSCAPEDLECEKVASYPFTLFKEVGTLETDKLYTESTYFVLGTVSEDYTVILDLSETNFNENYSNVRLFMELHDSNGDNVRPTLYDSIETFNVYSEVESQSSAATLSLTTDYSGTEIFYNTNSLTEINLTSKIIYKTINENKIIDTTHEGKKIGISIKLVDDEGTIVERKYLKNILFKVGDNSFYYPGNDNTVRVNLNNGINDVSKTLSVITNKNNIDLEEGMYYFKITNYIAYDGYYYEELADTELSIPLNVSENNVSVVHGFNVIMSEENQMIDKEAVAVNVPFSILENGEFESPNIRVSLYKKNELTAYNQDYTIVDLADYVSDTLNECEENVYYVTTEPVSYTAPEYSYNAFELNLLTANFENNGYKFVFELFDEDKRIGTIEKYFIVK